MDNTYLVYGMGVELMPPKTVETDSAVNSRNQFSYTCVPVQTISQLNCSFVS
jgi:hypothetical protein